MKFNVYFLIEVYFIIELEIEFDLIVWGVFDLCYFFQLVDNEEVLEVFGFIGKRQKKGRNCYFFLFDFYMNLFKYIYINVI